MIFLYIAVFDWQNYTLYAVIKTVPKFITNVTLLVPVLYFYIYTNKPRHDKTNKMSVCPLKTQISLGIRPVWSESLLCAQWVAKDRRFLHADSEDWSDWADAQADLSLHWTHTHFVGFVMSWLKLSYEKKNN